MDIDISVRVYITTVLVIRTCHLLPVNMLVEMQLQYAALQPLLIAGRSGSGSSIRHPSA